MKLSYRCRGRTNDEVPAAADLQDPEVTVVIPVYRNRETLRELHSRLRKIFETGRISYEIIFVDDSCPEGSLAVLEELARDDPRVAALALEQNTGQHRAVLTGLRFARGKSMVVMDADLQDPPEAIPVLLSKMKEGFDAVFAGRRGRYESRLRLLTSRLFKGLLHLLCGVPADAGMFFVISRQMGERLLAINEPHPFAVAMIGCTGLSMASVPVVRARRPDGGSAYSSWKRLGTGFLTAARVLAWKWNSGKPFPGHCVSPVPVKTYTGARFVRAVENPLGGEKSLEARLPARITQAQFDSDALL